MAKKEEVKGGYGEEGERELSKCLAESVKKENFASTR